MAAEVKNILIGAGTLVIGDTDVGYTRGGITISKDGDFLNVEPDQVLYPVITQKTTESYQVSTELLEVTLANLKLAWGESAAIGGGPSLSLGAPEVDVSEYTLVFNGRAPKGASGNYGDRTVTFHRVVTMDYGDIEHTRDGETVIPVTFTALYDVSEGEVGNIEDDIS